MYIRIIQRADQNTAGPTPRVTDLVGLALDSEFTFLKHAQVIHLILVYWAVLRGTEEGFLKEVMSKQV